MRAWLARIGLWAALLLATATLQAQPLQPVPTLTARVVDTTGTLDAGQRAQLEQALARLEHERGAQVVVLLVATTAPEDIAAYANRVANAWQIGRRDVGDGVLLLVAKNDRRLRIEVAKTLEGAIPDLAARQIIDEAIAPRLRQNDYAGALLAGVAQLDARIRGENLPAPEPAKGHGGEGLGEDMLAPLLFALFFAVPVVAGVLRGMLGRRLGAAATGIAAGAFAALVLQAVWWLALGAGLLAFVIALVAGLSPVLRPGSRRGRGRIGPGPGGWAGGAGGFAGGWTIGGGGDGGGGGGGFSSGGGGDFGGGGASGDW
ncbi:YgcG family protein [Pseudorhodoferax sp. Leaf274]|uniref:TPM domain-containing protein n=1 Tax=Pseudorhodoferax sp. Leaf274 TaxID=1736318 RepID=UPI00070300F2|nr:TPM domain-containing protein [Pseudorhodoferax sp. Leaf274]KQP38112.1 hypothetical protein ASF44_12945 [Pseudorhodoferax sp. Leaf274]